MENILDRFLRYVRIDTQSDENSQTQPSTEKQLTLLRLLTDELHGLGIQADIDENGYVYAAIPANTDAKVPALAFIAHADTSPDASGKDVKPTVIPNYDGGEIVLPGATIRPSEFPELLAHKGQTIITSDGTTLLGADDKAGIAEIMYAAEYLMTHPEFRHGPVKIAFTPDEEIGRGVVKFDVGRLGADYGYTMDGGEIGELEFENFNAASARITVHGRNVHPGYAKGRMINALHLAQEFDALLPAAERPETTCGYEGFYHLTATSGTVEQCSLSYIIRDHDAGTFATRKDEMAACAERMNAKYGDGTVVADIRDQYYNMREKVQPHYHIVETAVKAMEMAGVKPHIQPIRGGTDGANLSFRGLPCPNIFAGGNNFHSRLEWIPLESMQKASEVILNIVKLFSEDRSQGRDK